MPLCIMVGAAVVAGILTHSATEKVFVPSKFSRALLATWAACVVPLLVTKSKALPKKPDTHSELSVAMLTSVASR